MAHGTSPQPYDMTSNLDGASYENVHSMSITGKDNDITEDDLLQFAKQNGIKNAKRIIEEVSLAISHFYDYATNHQIDDYWKDCIEKRLSGLVPPVIGETMKHYLAPSPKRTKQKTIFRYQKATLLKTPDMTFVSRL